MKEMADIGQTIQSEQNLTEADIIWLVTMARISLVL